MASETPEDDKNPIVNGPPEGGRLAESPEGERIDYEDISFTDQPGFKPMIGIGSLVLISFFLLVGLPQYAEPGDGGLTLFTYTAVLWGLVIIACGFLYEYWLMTIEGDGW